MMFLKIKHFVVFVTIGLVCCRQQSLAPQRIEAAQIQIDGGISQEDSISAYLKPYVEHVNAVLDSTLAYAPRRIAKDDGRYNTTAGNLMADIIMEAAQPLFKEQTGKSVDFVLLNHGGIRSIISQGPVSERTAYQVMPFENTIVVVGLQGKAVKELVAFLASEKRAHPIANMQIELDRRGGLHSVRIAGKPIEDDKRYFVATSSYLVTGGDDMVFFKEAIETYETGYKIRNAMVDYFKKVDTLNPKVDDRFIQLP